MKISSYSTDEVVISEGEIGEKFYILYSGEVSISKGQKFHVLNPKITQVNKYSLYFAERIIFRNTFVTSSLGTLSENLH